MQDATNRLNAPFSGSPMIRWKALPIDLYKIQALGSQSSEALVPYLKHLCFSFSYGKEISSS
jgi:hypothetical protein